MAYKNKPSEVILANALLHLDRCRYKENASMDSKKRIALRAKIIRAYKIMLSKPEYNIYLTRDKYKHVLDYKEAKNGN